MESPFPVREMRLNAQADRLYFKLDDKEIQLRFDSSTGRACLEDLAKAVSHVRYIDEWFYPRVEKAPEEYRRVLLRAKYVQFDDNTFARGINGLQLMILLMITPGQRCDSWRIRNATTLANVLKGDPEAKVQQLISAHEGQPDPLLQFLSCKDEEDDEEDDEEMWSSDSDDASETDETIDLVQSSSEDSNTGLSDTIRTDPTQAEQESAARRAEEAKKVAEAAIGRPDRKISAPDRMTPTEDPRSNNTQTKKQKRVHHPEDSAENDADLDPEKIKLSAEIQSLEKSIGVEKKKVSIAQATIKRKQKAIALSEQSIRAWRTSIRSCSRKLHQKN